MAQVRRCSNCGVSWPSSFKYYQKCPQCGRATDAMTVTNLSGSITEEEGASIINHINFEKHMAGKELLPAPPPKETHKIAQEKFKARKERSERFEEVIAAGGFTEAEMKHFEHLERLIAHKPTDPSYDDQTFE